LISSKLLCQQMHSLLKHNSVTRRTAPSTRITYCHSTATILTMYFFLLIILQRL
jgi:hypothetical protein